MSKFCCGITYRDDETNCIKCGRILENVTDSAFLPEEDVDASPTVMIDITDVNKLAGVHPIRTEFADTMQAYTGFGGATQGSQNNMDPAVQRAEYEAAVQNTNYMDDSAFEQVAGQSVADCEIWQQETAAQNYMAGSRVQSAQAVQTGQYHQNSVNTMAGAHGSYDAEYRELPQANIPAGRPGVLSQGGTTPKTAESPGTSKEKSKHIGLLITSIVILSIAVLGFISMIFLTYSYTMGDSGNKYKGAEKKGFVDELVEPSANLNNDIGGDD